MSEDVDFYEVVKYVDDPPDVDEEKLQEYLDQGMWPDKASEHVAYYQSKSNAEDRRERMKESSDTHRSNSLNEDGGWFIVIRQCTFDDR